MKTHTVIIGVPETWVGTSYHRATVKANSPEEAKEKALEAIREGEAEYLGAKMHESEFDYAYAEATEIIPWEFEAGQMVMKKHAGPGVYPDTPVTILERMAPGGHKCPACGIGRGPDSMDDQNAYWVNFPTGSTGIVNAGDLRAKLEETT
jgi:hypothetical protein